MLTDGLNITHPMIDDLRPLCAHNNLQIWPRPDSNAGGSDLWSNALPLDHGGTPSLLVQVSVAMT